MRFLPLSVLALVGSSLWTGPASANTIHVPADEVGILPAIEAAAAFGDTILVAPGIYTGPNNSGMRFYGKQLVLMSEGGAEVTIIDASALGDPNTAFSIQDGETRDTVIDGFTIANGWSESDGGGMLVLSSPTIRNCIFRDNLVFNVFEFEEVRGGAVATSGAARFENCAFYNNRAIHPGPDLGFASGGAVYALGGDAEFDHCIFANNESSSFLVEGNGGAVYGHAANLSFTNCSFFGNKASHDGSGLWLAGGTTTLTRSIVAFGEGSSIHCILDPVVDITCTDMFGNVGGDWLDPCVAVQAGVNGNLSEDPLFCDSTVEDFHLSNNSPCAPSNSPPGCELIGALGVNCGTTAVIGPSETVVRPLARVTPNPVRATAHFRFPVGARGAVRIFSVVGRFLAAMAIDSENVEWTVPATLPAGVYFARFNTNEASKTIKFVIER